MPSGAPWLSRHMPHAAQLEFQVPPPVTTASQSVRSADVHCTVTFVLSHHLYHWQQLVVFTSPTEARPACVPSKRTVGVNPVAGGGEGGVW